MEKLDLRKKCKTVLLFRESDLTELEEQRCCNLNEAVSIIVEL